MLINLFVKHNTTNNIIVNENIEYDILKNKIAKKLSIKNQDFFLIHKGKLLNKNVIFYNNDIIEVKFRQRGGFFGIIITIGMIIVILVVLAGPLGDLVKALVGILEIFMQLLGLFPKILSIIKSIFNPSLFINDVIFAVTYSIRSLFDGILSSITSGSTPNKKKSKDKTLPSVCIPPTFMNLLILVLCPPLAMFLDRGISGLFHVIICSVLTMKLYYFPGLIYGALHILC